MAGATMPSDNLARKTNAIRTAPNRILREGHDMLNLFAEKLYGLIAESGLIGLRPISRRLG